MNSLRLASVVTYALGIGMIARITLAMHNMKSKYMTATVS